MTQKHSRSLLFCDVKHSFLPKYQGQPIGTIFRGQAVFFFFRILDSRRRDTKILAETSVTIQSALHNIQQERRPHLNRAGILKSRKVLSCVTKLSIGLAGKNCANFEFLSVLLLMTYFFLWDMTLYLSAGTRRCFGRYVFALS